MCILSINCKKIYPNTVARLVAIAFIPNPDNKPEIDHINTIKTDNRVSNLRWATSYENAHNSITEKRVQDARSKQIGKHFSDETKRKISENMKGEKNIWWGKKGSMHPRSKPVLQFSLDGELIKEWVNAASAQKIYGGHVTSCARGDRNQCGGYRWKYKSDYLKERL